jgi:hypothetical protein
MAHTEQDKKRYGAQKYNAKQRGVEFKLTFADWYKWWIETGHYSERGCKNGQYVMGRIGDQGAYELGNIYCCTTNENGSVAKSKVRKLSDSNVQFIRANAGKIEVKEMAQKFGVSGTAISKVIKGLSYK